MEPIRVGIVGAGCAARFHLLNLRRVYGVPRPTKPGSTNFMESIAQKREPMAGADLARDTIATIYAAYVSAQQQGAETEIPD